MRHRAITLGAGLATLALALALAGTAEARNPNCAGGIQYVVQAMRDKEKGNLEDYQREMLKAVDRLTMCSNEDPEDFEALAYLGWACAEIDSACPAGQAFQKAIAGLKARNDKKVDWAISNRESYWAKNFNQGVADIQAGQAAYAEFTKEPADDGERALKAEAANKYASAIAALDRAACLRPGDGRTARNLGTVYALMGDMMKADAVLREGLVAAPGDTDLVNSLSLVRRGHAGKLLDEKKYAEAIGFYVELLKSSPDDAGLHSGLADAYFKRAFTLDGDARKPDFKSAGDEYSKAAALKGGEPDLLFNAALAYQNGGEYVLAEGQWREFVKVKPDETEALSAFGSTLAELKKYDEAAAALHRAVNLKPMDKNLHRQLGGVYSKAGNNDASSGEIMLYLALSGGVAAENPAEAAKKAPAKSAAAATLASMGAPEELRYWESEGQKFETWAYWQKKIAYSFTGGVEVAKANWGVPPPKLEKPAPATPAKPTSRVVGKKK